MNETLYLDTKPMFDPAEWWPLPDNSPELIQWLESPEGEAWSYGSHETIGLEFVSIKTDICGWAGKCGYIFRAFLWHG